MVNKKKGREIALAVDLRILANILDDYKSDKIEFSEAARRINGLYEYSARTYEIDQHERSLELQERQLLQTINMAHEQHEDIGKLIKAMRGGGLV